MCNWHGSLHSPCSKGQKEWEGGQVSLTQADLPGVLTSGPCLHSWRAGSVRMEGGDCLDDSGGHTTSPALTFLLLWAAERDEICKVLLRHLAPSVSFLLPFPTTFFNKHNEIDKRGGLQEANSSFPKCRFLETSGICRKFSRVAVLSSAPWRYWKKMKEHVMLLPLFTAFE